jgi:hypothetical protein
MIVIAEPYAHYASTLPAGDIDRAAAALLQSSDEIARTYFTERYQQFEVAVLARVEIGSTRTWVTIATIVNALIFYGNVRQSVDYLVKDGQSLGRMILNAAPASLGTKSGPPSREERRLGIPGALQRLFARVESGGLPPDEATTRALALLQKSGGVETIRELPTLTERLAVEFEHAASGRRAQLSVDVGQAAAQPERPPHPDKSREAHLPDMTIAPPAPLQRRRGAVASKDPETGTVLISRY